MKPKQKIFFILLFSFAFLKSEAQKDSSLISKTYNQICIEGLGNGFIDYSYPDVSFISICYTHKVILTTTSFMLSLGIGQVISSNFSSIKPPDKVIDFPAGILFRGKYKRNGLWGGIFFTPCFGKIQYRDAADQPHFVNGSFEISPNLSYQFQSKSEHFFIKISFTPKILASAFTKTEKYGYGDKIFPFWGGICIGGAW